MKKIIYLIRHSLQYRNIEYQNNNEDDQTKNEKIVLSIEGEKLAEELSENNELEGIQELWSSNYCRAIATAKYISERNNIIINIDERLNERKLGNLEKLKELGENKTRSFVEEQLLNENFKNIDGESRKEVYERMSSCINDILDTENEKIAIVSHGAAIKYYLLKVCELDEKCNLIYKGKILNITSPCLLKITFEDKKIIEINQII